MERIIDRNESALTSRRFVLMKWFIFWILLTFVGLLFTGSFYVSRLAADENFSIFNALNSQMLRFQVWFVFSILIIFLDHKFRTRFKSWKYLFPLHFLASIVWALTATVVFSALYWFFNGIINSNFSVYSETLSAALIPNLVMGIVGYKIILTTNVAIDYYKKFQEETKRSAMLEKQLAQAQLQALKMQLQPHFLFNTLNSVSNLTLENPRNAVQMIARLGDFLRLTINSNGTQKVSLGRELEFLKHYLEIEKMRFQDRLKVEFETDENSLGAEVPNLILQPLVENAIKHGISKTMAAEKIKFSAKRIENRLHIAIENDGLVLNGNGFTREGIGLKNTRERLEQLYGEDFRFELQPLEQGGARVILEIPFVESKEFARELRESPRIFNQN